MLVYLVIMILILLISIPDTDECMEPSSCSQKCVNIKGSYKCLCDDGYQILPDNKHCAALRSEFDIFLNTKNSLHLLKYYSLLFDQDFTH